MFSKLLGPPKSKPFLVFPPLPGPEPRMSFKNESQESFDESAKDHGLVPFPPPPDEPAVLLHPDEDPDDDPDPVLPDDD